MPKIGIILSSTRDTRFADIPAKWVLEAAAKRDNLQVELLDLRDYPLPFFNEVASNAWAPTQDETGVRWQQKLAGFDGFIFITAEYNHSIPAALKNAIDFASTEWNRKPAAYVGYGAVGGARAIEHLRLMNAEGQMAPLRNAVHIQGADFFAVAQGKTSLESIDYLNEGLEVLLDELTWWAQALEAARKKDTKDDKVAVTA
jgi:NAD(P)H-dependent FMN reductase